MSSERVHEEKGHVKPRPEQKEAEPAKDGGRPELGQGRERPDVTTVQQMQKVVGNAAVQRFLVQRQESGPTEIDEETASTIHSARGSGHPIDGKMAETAGAVMGEDFDDVNVHTDAQADELNRNLGAKAFTTGNDIFFREGAYAPHSEDGQELIAHELTHVAQQGGAPPLQTKMVVNDPDDQFEAEADRVAGQVTGATGAAVQRQAPEEEEMVQAQAVEEEEELVQAQAVEEEEEMVQAQAVEEEEELVQAQEVEEEEEVAAG